MQPSNTLKIESLNQSWRDKDSILLHACFQLLKDCVEKENLLSGHADCEADDKHRLAKVELEDLYFWWLSYREPEIPSDESYQLENQMLIRLIQVRWALWA